MNKLTLIIFLFNIISFFIYGMNCLLTNKMVNEFSRYRLSKLRVPIGLLQILLSLTMLYGYITPLFMFTSASILATVMLAAIIVRLKIKDNLVLILPAIIYFIINSYLALYSIP